MKQFIQALRKHEKGQSLVEVAIFLPIFIIILAGVIEVSHIAITQNRVTTAARASTRYASNGGENSGMPIVALNAVTGTLDLDAEHWDMWAIRAKANAAGTGFDQWEVEHTYGLTQTGSSSQVDWDDIKAQVLASIQSDGTGAAAGLKLVGTYAIHDVDSILGLDALPGLIGFQSVDALNVMRIIGDPIEVTNGCSAFPIAVGEPIRSLNAPGGGSNPYPAAGDFDYPSAPPTFASFYNNQPNVPLTDAREGYIFKIQNGSGSGNFGWLYWNTGIPASSGTLADSLTWPGNSNDYTNHGQAGGGQPATPLYNWVVRGYVNPYDATDLAMNIGDWVPGDTGSVNSQAVRTALQANITNNRTLRLPVWNNATGTGNNARYQITRFGIFRLRGYHLSQNSGSWILAEFIRWDNSCGQSIP